MIPRLPEVVVHSSFIDSLSRAYVGMYILNKVTLKHGMSQFVFVSYRKTISTLVIALDYVLCKFVFKKQWRLYITLWNKKHNVSGGDIILIVNDLHSFNLYNFFQKTLRISRNRAAMEWMS